MVSDPYGKPVVIKVGDEYSWNDTLDGVTMWVLGSGEQGIYKAGTTKFESGEQLIVFDQMLDDINGNETYRYPFTIDENGYLKVSESVYQYYNVVDAKDGQISIISGSNGVESVAENGINEVTMHWFTTRAAAEEFYNSKTSTLNWEQYDDFSSLIGDNSGSGYAPESIVGSVVNINLNFTEGIEEQTETYFKDKRYFITRMVTGPIMIM